MRSKHLPPHGNCIAPPRPPSPPRRSQAKQWCWSSPVPSSHQRQGTLPALNIQFPSPSPPCEGVQHGNEPAGLPVPCAGRLCLGGCCMSASCRSRWEQRRAASPPYTAERWPWGPVSPSSRPTGPLILLLQCGVQPSPHLSPRFGSGQELLPLPYPHSPPPLKHQLACSLRGAACCTRINTIRPQTRSHRGLGGLPVCCSRSGLAVPLLRSCGMASRRGEQSLWGSARREILSGGGGQP